MLSITGAIVIYAVLWFMCLFVILPIRLKTQGDLGEVAPGTPASAPEAPALKKRFAITTIVATALWGLIIAVMLTGVLSLDDLPVWQLPDHSGAAAELSGGQAGGGFTTWKPPPARGALKCPPPAACWTPRIQQEGVSP